MRGVGIEGIVLRTHRETMRGVGIEGIVLRTHRETMRGVGIEGIVLRIQGDHEFSHFFLFLVPFGYQK